MAYKSAKNGWYRVLNSSKFINQMQESKSVMKSTRMVQDFLEINYKSGLELKCLYMGLQKYINNIYKRI